MNDYLLTTADGAEHFHSALTESEAVAWAYNTLNEGVVGHLYYVNKSIPIARIESIDPGQWEALHFTP